MTNEKAYTPTDDERTYLASVIRSGFDGLDTASPDDEDYAIADVVLAAGFHRSSLRRAPVVSAWANREKNGE